VRHGPPTDVAFTVAHEARHLWQYRNGQGRKGRLAGELEYQAAEADANDYAYLMLRRFMGER
jgi:hypothetical protein